MPKVQRKKTRRRATVVVAPRRKKAPEMTRLGSALRALGGLGGTALGGLIGMPSSGGSVGTGLGASLSRWLGAGDYEVNKNSIVQKLEMSGSVPEMHKSDQTIIVRHREFITTVNSSQAFAVQQSFDINPGNVVLFPWLAGIAARFQEYKIRGMVYHYVPTSGSAVASTNPALGAVMLQTSYRASDSAPSSKVEMLNEYNSNESVPCDAFCHPIECDPKENPFNIQYVRTNNTATVEDKLLYDLGTTHLAVQGCQTTGNPIGDLWVTYEVELKKPLVVSNIASAIRSYTAVTSSTNTASMFSTITSASGSLPILIAGNRVLFGKGTFGSYQITLRLTSALTSLTAWAAPTLTNCTYLPIAGGFTWLTTTQTAGGTLDGPTAVLWVTISDTQTSWVDFAALTGTGTISGTVLSVTPFYLG